LVTLKVFYTALQADSEAMMQFRQRAEQVAALQHPNIARLHDLLVFPSSHPESPSASIVCLVTEYVEGQTLADYLHNTASRGNIRAWTEIAQLIAQVSLAVDHAHRHGILHGNLKPTNILLRQAGEPVVTDFGFLKLLKTPAGITNPLYLSPEQIRGQPATERSDTYSLGIMLYELCTGVLPFRGSRPVAIMMQHLNAPPTPPALMNPTVPSGLTNVILRSLAKEPEMRYSSAPSLAVALTQAVNIPIPESLQQSTDIPAILHELEDNGLAPRSLAQADATALLAPAPPHAGRAGAQQHTTGSPGAAYSPVAAQARRRKRSAFGPWFLVSLLGLLLAVAGTIGTLLLFPQGTKTTPSIQLLGHAYFLNSGQFNATGPQGINDELQVALAGIPDPPTGKSYYSWLLADRSVSESLPLALGSLHVDHGTIRLLYRGDAEHTNLLGVASRFLITVDDARHPSSNPLLDTSTWRYYAEIPEQPSPDDKLHFSMLDHLRHLLVESPELRLRGLHGGLAFWFVRNSFALLEAASGAREAWRSGKSSAVRDQVISVLDYLDGASFVQTELPRGTPLLGDAHAVQVALLGPSPTNPDAPGYVYGGEVPPGYVYLISEHMGGAIESSQTTADQRALAVEINRGLDEEKGVLEQVHQDAKQLLKMDGAHLLQPAGLAILNDLAAQAQEAYTGQVNPSTGQPVGGALWTYDKLQRLAAFDVRPYFSPTQ